eukprot:gene21875-biopygen14723
MSQSCGETGEYCLVCYRWCALAGPHHARLGGDKAKCGAAGTAGAKSAVPRPGKCNRAAQSAAGKANGSRRT